MLAECPAGFVVIELTAGNVDAVLSRMARFERDFPLARVAVVAARSMASYRWLLREAGAVDFVTSPRRLAALGRPGLPPPRPGAPRAAEPIRADLERLPWAASGSGSGSGKPVGQRSSWTACRALGPDGTPLQLAEPLTLEACNDRSPMTIDRVNRALAEFKEPETGRSIVQVKQIHDVKLDGDNVSVTLGLTTFSAPVWKTTQAELEEHLRRRLPEAAADRRQAGPARAAGGEDRRDRPGRQGGDRRRLGQGRRRQEHDRRDSRLRTRPGRAATSGCWTPTCTVPAFRTCWAPANGPRMIDDRIEPITIDGVKVMSMGLLVPPGEAVIWRGSDAPRGHHPIPPRHGVGRARIT